MEKLEDEVEDYQNDYDYEDDYNYNQDNDYNNDNDYNYNEKQILMKKDSHFVINQEMKIEILNIEDQKALLEITLKKLSIEYEYYFFDHIKLINLLNKNNWDLNKFNNYINDKYEANFLEIQPQKEAQFDCLICFDTIITADTNSYYQESCGHSFCLNCYEMHVKIQYENGLQSIQSRCPQNGCTKLLSRKTYKHFLDKEQLAKYERYLVENMIINNTSLFHCPGRNCENVLNVLDEDFINKKKQNKQGRNFRCSCGYHLCLICLQEGHMPMKCDIFKQFYGIAIDKSNYMNYLWIEVNSKKCPNCETNIEKDKGCMKMDCSSCNHLFCWLCLRPWDEHSDKTGGYYVCNKFQEDPKKNEESNKKLNQLKELEFYADRFFEHRKSHEEAIKKQKIIMRLFNKYMCRHEFDYDYIQTATDLIISSRRAIGYSYGEAYFISDKNKKSFMQFLQSDLEGQLELLDNLTDQLTNSENYPSYFTDKQLNQTYETMKLQIINLSSTLSIYFSNILKQLEDDLPDVETDGPIKLKKQESFYDEKKLAINDNSHVWTCTICTFVNEIVHNTCQMCTRSRVIEP